MSDVPLQDDLLVRNALVRIGVNASVKWTRQCIEYKRRSLSSSGTTFSGHSSDPTDQLAQFIYEMYLLADFRTIEPRPLLPSTLNTPHKQRLFTVSSGTAVDGGKGGAILQILEIQDIGISSLAMLESCESIGVEGEQPGGFLVGKTLPKGGTYLLDLTDGVRMIKAMVVRPIDGIAVEMKLGTKIRVKDVEVRHGILQLSPSNTALLGGEVASMNRHPRRLVIMNQMKKKLGLPLDSLPLTSVTAQPVPAPQNPRVSSIGSRTWRNSQSSVVAQDAVPLQPTSRSAPSSEPLQHHGNTPKATFTQSDNPYLGFRSNSNSAATTDKISVVSHQTTSHEDEYQRLQRESEPQWDNDVNLGMDDPMAGGYDDWNMSQLSIDSDTANPRLDDMDVDSSHKEPKFDSILSNDTTDTRVDMDAYKSSVDPSKPDNDTPLETRRPLNLKAPLSQQVPRQGRYDDSLERVIKSENVSNKLSAVKIVKREPKESIRKVKHDDDKKLYDEQLPPPPDLDFSPLDYHSENDTLPRHAIKNDTLPRHAIKNEKKPSWSKNTLQDRQYDYNKSSGSSKNPDNEDDEWLQQSTATRAASVSTGKRRKRRISTSESESESKDRDHVPNRRRSRSFSDLNRWSEARVANDINLWPGATNSNGTTKVNETDLLFKIKQEAVSDLQKDEAEMMDEDFIPEFDLTMVGSDGKYHSPNLASTPGGVAVASTTASPHQPEQENPSLAAEPWADLTRVKTEAPEPLKTLGHEGHQPLIPETFNRTEFISLLSDEDDEGLAEGDDDQSLILQPPCDSRSAAYVGYGQSVGETELPSGIDMSVVKKEVVHSQVASSAPLPVSSPSNISMTSVMDNSQGNNDNISSLLTDNQSTMPLIKQEETTIMEFDMDDEDELGMSATAPVIPEVDLEEVAERVYNGQEVIAKGRVHKLGKFSLTTLTVSMPIVLLPMQSSKEKTSVSDSGLGNHPSNIQGNGQGAMTDETPQPLPSGTRSPHSFMLDAILDQNVVESQLMYGVSEFRELVRVNDSAAKQAVLGLRKRLSEVDSIECLFRGQRNRLPVIREMRILTKRKRSTY
ncbi:hypothetical protein BGW38_000848 [Lunasporangiospora selenospora]|uniref:RecQ-mediated genome instability protein 1 n=1 Tax=Lunasporangiospora selenospora TaxID=979761 RepID=A0A9P6G1X9_9FUNG|nr:hypothetical protein BGW38_000848 [Lunasporangiospora selenospora]